MRVSAYRVNNTGCAARPAMPYLTDPRSRPSSTTIGGVAVVPQLAERDAREPRAIDSFATSTHTQEACLSARRRCHNQGTARRARLRP